MTPADAAEMLGLAAAYDNRTVSEVAARAWAEAIDERVTVPDARRLIIGHYARTREWIMPADINAGSAALRRDRLERMTTPQPPESIDPDDTSAGLIWQRAYRRAIGDGLDETAADIAACRAVGVTRPALPPAPRPVLALVEQTAAALPRIPRAGGAA